MHRGLEFVDQWSDFVLPGGERRPRASRLGRGWACGPLTLTSAIIDARQRFTKPIGNTCRITDQTTRLRDVAGRAGVSVTTVSQFLNGQIRLPDTTSARIAEALRVLEYQPNLHARRLSTGRSDTIGLVVPDIANPFFARLAAAVEMAADARGLQLALFATLNRPGRERAYVEALSRNHVDGLIFATNHANHGGLHDLINATGRVSCRRAGQRRRGASPVLRQRRRRP